MSLSGDGNSRTVWATVNVEASVDKLWSCLTDYENLVSLVQPRGPPR